MNLIIATTYIQGYQLDKSYFFWYPSLENISQKILYVTIYLYHVFLQGNKDSFIFSGGLLGRVCMHHVDIQQDMEKDKAL